jgi:putative ABC transport system substrate-binding protein
LQKSRGRGGFLYSVVLHLLLGRVYDDKDGTYRPQKQPRIGDEEFVEGRNVAIEQRHADNQLDRLPALAADLVRRQVSVIVGKVVAVDAARAATTTIPIVFVTGEDPIQSGLVASLNRPEANLTGVTFFGGSTLNAKQLELLRDLVPKTAVFAMLGDVNYPAFEAGLL